MKRYFKYSVTPTVGASSAYAAGDFVGEVMEKLLFQFGYLQGLQSRELRQPTQ